MSTRIEQVFEALANVPEATAKDLSKTLNRTSTSVSQLLGQLFWKGLVDRQRTGNLTVEYLYRVKTKAPRVWPYPVRLAKRETERV